MSDLYVPQRFLAGHRNKVRVATLMPSSVQSIASAVLEEQRAREGTAGIAITGTYIGEEQAEYELKIVDTTATNPQASQPVFVGEGSGILKDIVVDPGAAVQKVTVKLVVDGVPLKYAGLEVEGELLSDRVGGIAGDLLELTVDISGLVYTDTTFSLLEGLATGAGGPDSPMIGPQYDWDSAVLGQDNIVPASAKRLSFGDDPTVYVQFKKYENGDYSYYLTPALKRDVKAGEIIKEVTGSRSVTITNGVDTETFTNVVTLYDLLNQIDTTSLLVRVDGLVVNDRSPTGMATRDLQTSTDARALTSTGSGGPYAAGLTDVEVGSDTPTELVSIKCFAVNGKDYPFAHLGHEYWEVTGSVSGPLGNAVTGERFAHPDGHWAFVIPSKLPPGYSIPKGNIAHTATDYEARQEGDPTPPPICVVAMALGPDAVDQTVTATYTKRPTGDCDCTTLPIPNLKTPCLGVVGEGGTVGYQADTITRLKSLYAWYAGVVRDNSAYGANLGSFETFITGAGVGNGPSLKGLISNFETVAGQLDAVGDSALRLAGFAAWDAAVATLQDDVADYEDPVLSAPAGTDPFNAECVENVAEGDALFFWKDGADFYCRKAIRFGPDSTSAVLETRYGWAGSTVTSGNPVAIYRTLGRIVTGLSALTPGSWYWMSETTPGAWTSTEADSICGVQVLGASIHQFVAQALSATELEITGGRSCGIYGGGGTITSILWSMLSERHLADLNSALMAGGISPLGKTDASISASGDGCWQDYGDPYYWAITGSDRGGYAPAFNNRPYWSSKKAETDGLYYSTHEFAFQINIVSSCISALREGDSLTIVIGAAAYPATYQVGDELRLPLISAGALEFKGGQDASEVQTWNVDSSTAGPLAPYSFDPNAPVAYTSADFDFLLEERGIPWARGDTYTFEVEGGHFQYRKNSGAWSASLSITTSAQALDSGLSVAFVSGSAPSYVQDDAWKFTALQPWAASSLQISDGDVWKWSGSSATLVADLGAEMSVDCLCIALHTLPAGCTVLVEGGVAPGVYTWSQSMTWQAGAFFKLFYVEMARYLKLTLTNVTDGSIGYWWAGEAFKPETAADVTLRSGWKMERENVGLLQGARYLGKTRNARVEWQQGTLTEDDAVELMEMFDWMKENDDELCLLIPQATRSESVLARLVEDEVEFPDELMYHPDNTAERLLSASFTLAGQWQQ